MSFTKKTWTDRISEYPTRRTLTKEDGTTETVTVTREEGTISQEGDAYSAANMNDLEQRVADGFSTLSQDSVKIATKNTTSDSIAFGIDSNGNYGYIKEGADTVTPFKSQTDIDNAYSAGVSDADARVNTSSASYKSAYNAVKVETFSETQMGGSHGKSGTVSLSKTYTVQGTVIAAGVTQFRVKNSVGTNAQNTYMSLSYSGSQVSLSASIYSVGYGGFSVDGIIVYR